jgi:vanillate O-demethylase monooxygenase subunit
VIEAQQRVIESAAMPLDPLILAVDVGPVRYKRILGKMLEAEAGRGPA